MTDSSATVEWLNVAGDADRWRSIGLVVGDDGSIPLIGASIRIVHPDGVVADRGDPVDSADRSEGIVGWTLSGVAPPPDGDIDGLATQVVEAQPPRYADHGLGASALDHVVVLTADLERTSAAIETATGCELRRVREVGEMRQGFHRIGRGGLIVELVERPDVPPGPAAFWGLVLILEDLDAACALLGPERVSGPKDAVQPGRRIATIRADVGLGLPVALMTA